MFIRYNVGLQFWEYDTSAGETGAGPWVILPVSADYLIGGGLPPNIAYTDRRNVFAAEQFISNGYPYLLFNLISGGADVKNVRLEGLSDFYISFVNDADNAYQQRFRFDRSGGLTVPAALAVGTSIDAGGIIQTPNAVRGGDLESRGNNGLIFMIDAGGPVNARAWQFIQYNNGNLYFAPANDGAAPAYQHIVYSRDGITEFLQNYTRHDVGAYFPNPQSNPGLLDHYEEGTYAPRMVSDAGGEGISYLIQSGSYTKVGNLVTVGFDVQIQSANWSGGNILISLPFSLNGNSFVGGTIGYFAGIAGGVYGISGYISPGWNSMYLTYKNALSGNSDGNILAGNIQPGTRFIGSVTFSANQ